MPEMMPRCSLRPLARVPVGIEIQHKGGHRAVKWPPIATCPKVLLDHGVLAGRRALIVALPVRFVARVLGLFLDHPPPHPAEALLTMRRT